MSEELKFTTDGQDRTPDWDRAKLVCEGKLAVHTPNPNYNITFHRDGKEIGRLDFNGPKMTFAGQAEESAVMFFGLIAKSFAQRLKQERLAEREECAKVCDELTLAHPGRADLTADQCAAAIRSRT